VLYGKPRIALLFQAQESKLSLQMFMHHRSGHLQHSSQEKEERRKCKVLVNLDDKNPFKSTSGCAVKIIHVRYDAKRFQIKSANVAQ